MTIKESVTAGRHVSGAVVENSHLDLQVQGWKSNWEWCGHLKPQILPH